jgi:hypothetical protein
LIFLSSALGDQSAGGAQLGGGKGEGGGAGQSVKSLRAGNVPASAAKSHLVAGPDGMPPLRLVSSNNGLDLALPDGELIDYNILALRHFQIFAFRVVGMGFL